MTNGDLEQSAVLAQMFADYNARFFGARLPRYKIRPYRELGRDRSYGRVLSKSREIRIYVGHDVAGTLLHEMAHASVSGRHGPLFWAEMKRLVGLGAPVSEADINYMAHPDGPLTRDEVEGSALEALCQSPAVTLSQFAGWFADLRGMSGSALLRKYPWVRKAFYRSRREAAEHRLRQDRLNAAGLGVKKGGDRR